jgi:IclR family transcriptional regulator, acetate operon repressor
MDGANGTAVLDKTFDILEAIGLSTEGLDNQQLVAQLNLPRATLYRVLALLVERGMVRPDIAWAFATSNWCAAGGWSRT